MIKFMKRSLYNMGNVFISVEEIKADDVKWIDARFSLQDVEAGRKQYKSLHVKNAIHWDLDQDLSNSENGGGRHPLPTKEELVELFEKSGIQLEDSIVVYDDGGNPFATRVWWILQYAGFKNARIALEGFKALQEAGVPVTDKLPSIERTTVSPSWQEDIYATRDLVEQVVAGKEDTTLIDARAAKRYRGEHEPLDRIAGHIPTALNFDWEQLKKDGQYNLGDDVKKQLTQLTADKEKLTVYCGSGVTATPLYAMLKHHGFENVRLYVGSYSDWVSKEDAPIETE